MNLYNYHEQPSQLVGYDIKEALLPDSAYEYLKNNPNGGNKQIAVGTISKDPEYAFKYARLILHDRFIQGEPTIAKKASTAKDYAEYVLLPLYTSGKIDSPRFHMGEPAIIDNMHAIYYYMRDIIKGRWAEGEQAILQSNIPNKDKFMIWIVQDIIKGRWVEAEEVMKNNKEWMEEYNYEISRF